MSGNRDAYPRNHRCLDDFVLLTNGRIIGGGAFGVGGLAHLLQNRFYIGEAVYRSLRAAFA